MVVSSAVKAGRNGGRVRASQRRLSACNPGRSMRACTLVRKRAIRRPKGVANPGPAG
jgi:hypothetical protein